MALQADHRAGSYAELMYLVANYDLIAEYEFTDENQPSFRELLSGRIFPLTPDEFFEFLHKVYDISLKGLPRYEYDDGVLLFKDTMNYVHNELCAYIADAVLRAFPHSPEGTGIPSLRNGYGLVQEFGTSPESRPR